MEGAVVREREGKKGVGAGTSTVVRRGKRSTHDNGGIERGIASIDS